MPDIFANQNGTCTCTIVVLWDWKELCCMKGALHSSSHHLEITTSKRHVDHLKTQSMTEHFFGVSTENLV